VESIEVVHDGRSGGDRRGVGIGDDRVILREN